MRKLHLIFYNFIVFSLCFHDLKNYTLMKNFKLYKITKSSLYIIYQKFINNISHTLLSSVDRRGKLTYDNSFSYSWINYFSATSITRTKVIFHSTNIFINLVKLMKRVKMGEEKERTMFFQ
jgi:hypothetical protein